jgi:amino acid adenylation domain-containing protein
VAIANKANMHDRALISLIRASAVAPGRSLAASAQTDAHYERSNLTMSQLLFWTAQKLQPELPLFNMATLLIISSSIEPEKFQRAFQTLLNSSDALRTVVRETDDLPQQVVVRPFSYEMEYLDYSNLDDPQAELRAWASVRSQSRLAMEERLFDSALVKLSDEKYAWYFNNHQIISDAWMSGLMFRLMSEFYRRALDGDLPDMVNLPPFQHYLEYERSYRRAPRYLKTEAYWKKKLAQEVEPINFYGRTPQKLAARVERVTYNLGRERTEKLKAIATHPEVMRTSGAPLFNLMAALLLGYLYRLSGNRTISLGIPFHNRRSKTFKETLGLFMEVCPLVVTVEPEDTYLSLMNKVAVEVLEITMRGGYAIGNPLQKRAYDVLLNFHLETIENFNGAPIEYEWIHPGAGNETLALQAHDFQRSGDLQIGFDFDCAVFDPAQRQEAIKQFLGVLNSCLEDVERPLASVSLMLPDERERILVDLNRTEAAFPSDRTFTHLFTAQVRKTPDRCAVAFGEQSLTYQQLNARANRVANHLFEMGVGPEKIVALLARRGIDLLSAIIGVMKAGAAYLPISPNDPGKRQRQIVGQSNCMMALVADEFMSGLRQASGTLHSAQSPSFVSLDELLKREVNEEDPPVRGGPESLAYVIYTSGSTGAPKGAMIEHRGMLNHLFAKIRDLELAQKDAVAETASQCFDISVWQFLAALLVGGRVHIFNDEIAGDASRLLAEVSREGITIIEAVPSLLRAMIENASPLGLDSLDLSALRWMIVTGEALPAEACGQWLDLHPNIPLLNAYGPTECSDDVTHYTINCRLPAGTVHAPIGSPIANTQLYVLDAHLQPLPVRVSGELYVGGVGVGRGYLNDPERTAQAFLPNSFSTEPGARCYRTGDLARHLNHGELDCLGRIDHQVKIRGFRVELGEIEAALKQHPGVKESVLAARDDGSGQKRLTAYLVARTDYRPDPAELQSFIKERVPPYMVPSAFMTLDAMPLNSNGKIDRQALSAYDSAPATTDSYVAPRNLRELHLAQIWQELLDIERVGVKDNFFDLGGDSLLAVRMLAQLRKRLRQDLPLSIIVEAGTIERLAVALKDQGAGINKSPLVAMQPKGSRPPFFCVHPRSGSVLGLLPIAHYMGEDQPFYGIQDPNTVEYSESGEANLAVTLEEMAAHYVEAVKTAQPRGPYHLGGWSFGGFVAFEMAQQLVRQGDEVGLLAILDAAKSERLGRADEAELLAIICEEMGAPISAEILRPLRPIQRSRYVAQRLEAANLMPADVSLTWIDFELSIFKARLWAVDHHVFKTYPGRITLFRAAEPDAYHSEYPDPILADPARGWGQHSTEPVDVQVVPGNHVTICREPNVGVLAEKLMACLEEAGSLIAVN